MGYVRIIRYILGLYWDNGKYKGNYYDYCGSLSFLGGPIDLGCWGFRVWVR